MNLIVGIIIVIASVLGGFMLSHGHILALWQPCELLITGGGMDGPAAPELVGLPGPVVFNSDPSLPDSQSIELMYDWLELSAFGNQRIVANLRIQFLAFEGCPLADAARHALDEAMTSLELSSYEIIDILDPDTPDDLRKWGSPTILVNGRDVTGGKQGNNVACRVYAGPLKVPDSQSIVDFIRREAVS